MAKKRWTHRKSGGELPTKSSHHRRAGKYTIPAPYRGTAAEDPKGESQVAVVRICGHLPGAAVAARSGSGGLHEPPRIPTSRARTGGRGAPVLRGVHDEINETWSNRPPDTDLSRKNAGPSMPNTDLSRKATDPGVAERPGKGQLKPPSAGNGTPQKRTIHADNLCRSAGKPNADPSDKGYRPFAQGIPTTHARQYRPWAQVLATSRARNTDLRSKNTDHSHKEYRPPTQVAKENDLQIRGFSSGCSVSMYVVFLLNVVLLQTGEA